MELRDYMLELMKAPDNVPEEDVSLDAATAADTYLMHTARLHAASALNAWAETNDEDLDDGETLADRLLTLLAEEAEEDGDEDMSESEQDMLGAVLAAAESYLLAHSVAADDVAELLGDWTEESAVRVRDALLEALPDGDEADEQVAAFTFDVASTESVFDGVYRNLVSFLGGKKTVIRKRIAGVAKRLSPKQRAALAKARLKARSASAKLARRKSVRARMKSGIGIKRKYA